MQLKLCAICFSSSVNTEEQCDELDGYYSLADKSCYYNGSKYDPVCKYLVNQKCYPYVDSSYTVLTCANIGGFFTKSSTHGESGNYCYYKEFNCTFHSANNQCYRFKTLTNNQSECNLSGGYYRHGYCYNNCPVSKYLINENCYDFRSAYTPQKCTDLHGYFNKNENYCYYGKTCISGYMVNEKCFLFVDSGYTASTCRNIGGYFTTVNKQGQSGSFCYFTQFICEFHAVNDQCYRVKSAVDHETECDDIRGYYKRGYCYYECPRTKYLINDQCYDKRSTQYTQTDCEAVGGVYVSNYCYIARCNYSSVNDHCYRYKTSTYTNSTCHNIGGYYATEMVPPYQDHCYYSSFNCRRHAVNGQCYTGLSNQSQRACQLIPDSYFDARNNTCYYYCTEFPTLHQCFAAINSSFTKETCSVIGGTYYSSTCYYITPYCPTYQANNGQCYTNRSATLNCDTCYNIGGHLENGYCYHYHYSCRKYSVDRQCYSKRSSAYSVSYCNDFGGYYRKGYCYYEVSKCSTSYYRNCTCFMHRTPSKTPGTCENIGGYYDFKIQQCFYNSTSCSLYNKSSQCYKYRLPNISQETCLSIRGYYSRERDEFGRYTYVCYLNKFYNCRDIPNVSECARVENPSFTRELCGIIGGIYSNSTCYHTASRCVGYNTSNGQCYANRSDALTCDTCNNIGGHFENGYCYYLEQYNCSGYSIEGQCYSSRTYGYSRSWCRRRDGLYRRSYCYYEASKCGNRPDLYKNCTCFLYSSTSKTASTCAIIGGYYDFVNQRCFYVSTCPSYYYSVNNQCYKHRNRNFSSTTCSLTRGYRAYEQDESGTYRYTCYYNEINCTNWINSQCYRSFSSSYNAGTCATIGGYYSENDQGCYYNSFSCSYSMGSQCYDTYYTGWSRTQCNKANGYYYYYYRYGRYRCYISNYYCPHVLTSYNKCYFFRSSSYNCMSCGLVDGFLYSGSCYHKFECLEPLFLGSNGQCYENQTIVTTEAECTSMPGEAFYNESTNLCYFYSGECSSGHYVNCRCYLHRADFYTAESCRNFGGYYTDGRCYYNSSHCPDRYHSVNAQCYRRSGRYSRTTCRNIGGYYDHQSTSGICYYNSFNCSGFTVDGRHCYTNRSAKYGRATTCRNIGGVYSYLYSGRQYRSAGSYISSSRSYYCLYNTFNCAGYTVNDECHLYQSTKLSADTCRNINGSFIAANHTCYYHEYSCPYYSVGGQCHPNVICDAFSCYTCHLYGGYYEPRTRCCYYTSRICQYFIDGECYETFSSLYNASTCFSVLNGYYSKGRCYYHARPNCSAGTFYQQCVCYPQRSATFSNDTCIDIDGFYANNYCYYLQFNCSGYAVNGQCYSRTSRQLTKGTCDNIGGYFTSANDTNNSTTEATITVSSPTALGRCYYSTFDCPYYLYCRQCYSGRSTAKSCPTCKNIGGTYISNTHVCYYYSSNCRYHSAGTQCHTDRSLTYNTTTCQRMDGYKHSDGYCYFTPNCSSSYHYLYANCQCYLYSSSSYTNATCINIRGVYFNGYCHYITNNCSGYRYGGQCYTNRFHTSYYSTCQHYRGAYDSNYAYCYYNSH